MIEGIFHKFAPPFKGEVKHLILTSLLGIFLFGTVFGAKGQKFAYVDTDYILKNIPEYQEAQKKLNRLSKKWQKEIDKKYEKINQMYRDLKAEKVLLTEEMKKKRKAEIRKKEKAVRELKKKRFGENGDLFKKRKELIQPIQDRVYSAIKKLAESRRYMVIFDKAKDSDILYGDERYDKSDRVLDILGYEPGQTQTENEKTSN